MKEWWHWSPLQGSDRLGFAIIGVGRFGIAVCRELLQSGADVLAVDRSARAIEELRQVEPSVEARVVDCTDEESLREAGVLEMGTVVVAISEPIEASITATLIAKDSEGSRVKQVIARATSDLHEKMLKRVGADRVIFPSRMQGERLGLELVRPNLMGATRPRRAALHRRNQSSGSVRWAIPAGPQPAQELPRQRSRRWSPEQPDCESAGIPCSRTRALARGDGPY